MAFTSEGVMEAQAVSEQMTLLPCPFCGGEADPESWQYIHGRYEGRIQCTVCKATAPNFAAWNDRCAPCAYTDADLNEDKHG